MEVGVCDSGQRRNATLLRDANSRALHIALVVAALFAILLQGFIVQAHTHAHWDMAPVVHAAKAQAVAGAAGDGSTQQNESDCPICWEMAHAGVFVLPGDALFPTPETSTIWVAALLPLVSVRNGRSHAWRSRAPPFPLQT